MTGKPSKYRNIKAEVDGHTFDSKAEARRWHDLKMLERAGLVSNIRCQVRFPIVWNGMKICDYVADFVYREADKAGDTIEDVKSPASKTPAYRLKAKMMAAQGLPITEVMK
jgi:hypothetical protein